MAGSTSYFNANLQSKLRANLDVSYEICNGLLIIFQIIRRPKFTSNVDYSPFPIKNPYP